MRRMCGLSSQIRNRSLLKSMRYMVRSHAYTAAKTVYLALTISRRRLTNGCKPGFWEGWRPYLVPELLAQDAFLGAGAGVEQHPHRDRLVGQHLDAADVADLVVVGHRRHRALVALQHLDHHEGGVGEQGAAPAPGPERADRRQRQQRRIDWQDRSLGGEVVGGGARG